MVDLPFPRGVGRDDRHVDVFAVRPVSPPTHDRLIVDLPHEVPVREQFLPLQPHVFRHLVDGLHARFGVLRISQSACCLGSRAAAEAEGRFESLT